MKKIDNNFCQKISVIILTHNEEKHISRCILSLKGKFKAINVIDSFSDDQTERICKKNRVNFIKNKFYNQSRQINWAIKKRLIKTPWVLRLDADEVLEKDFFKKINEIRNINDYNGIELVIEHNFFGDRIKRGGVYPQKQIRLWKKNDGFYKEVPMNERINISKPKIYRSNIKIIDNNLKGLTFWFQKHFKYAQREAVYYKILKKRKLPNKTIDPNISNRVLYYKFPIFIRTILLFLYRYIIKGGFLDGITGLKFFILQTLYYRLLVDFCILNNILFSRKK